MRSRNRDIKQCRARPAAERQRRWAFMNPAADFVSLFYSRFRGRVPLPAGIVSKATKVYPFVFTDGNHPIGVVAMATRDAIGPRSVPIFLIAAFETRKGHGSLMLRVLCEDADRMGVSLPLQAEPQWARNEDLVPPDKLAARYKRLGFQGNRSLVREPQHDAQHGAAAGERRSGDRGSMPKTLAAPVSPHDEPRTQPPRETRHSHPRA